MRSLGTGISKFWAENNVGFKKCRIISTDTGTQNFYLVQIKRICTQQFHCGIFIYDKDIFFEKENYMKDLFEKGKCCLPAFISPFPTMFLKDFFPTVIKCWYCEVRG